MQNLYRRVLENQMSRCDRLSEIYYNLIDKNWVHTLNGFAYYVALPALIISSFWKVDFTNPSTWFLIFESIAIIVLFSILIFGIVCYL